MAARYEEIAADLEQKIKDGRLAAGQQIKTEKELMAEYDAARNTVRDAIGRLRTQGIVESRQGRGTFVIRPPEEVFRITLTPERKTGFSGGEGRAWKAEADEQQRETDFSAPEVSIKQASPTIAEEFGVAESERLIVRHQRRYITDRSGREIPWSLQTSYYPFSFYAPQDTERPRAERLMDAEDIEEGTMAYLEETLGIRQARYRDLLSVRPPDDGEKTFFKLGAEGGVWVYVHRRTAYDTEDRPCRYTVTVYPTDRNEFVVEARMPNIDKTSS